MRRSRALPELTVNAWLRFDAIQHALDVAKPTRVLEIGCGEGALGSWLAEHYDYTAVEPGDRSREIARSRIGTGPTRHIVRDLDDVGDEQFDMLCAFEVMEHLDDVEMLQLWSARVRPGGWLLLSVPAHMKRFGPWDELAGHLRRYDRPVLETRVRDAGFAVTDLQTYGAGIGFVLERLRNEIARRREITGTPQDRTLTSGGVVQSSGTARSLLNYVAAAPFRVLQRPFAHGDRGVGWVLLARQRGTATGQSRPRPHAELGDEVP